MELPKLPNLPNSVIGVLHRGKSCAVVDKPAGLAVEADGDSLLKRLAKLLAPPGGRAWPRVVHRLDTGTSGCLAVALNQRGEGRLGTAFQQGEVEKQYLAIVCGAPEAEGSFDTAYGPDPRDARKHTTRIDTPRRARLSWTRVEALAGAALLRIRLETGRTHQIRVQFAEAGFPVLGDATYAEAEAKLLPPALVAAARDLGRPALHSASLSLPDPDAEESARLSCEAPLPADLVAALERLRTTT